MGAFNKRIAFEISQYIIKNKRVGGLKMNKNTKIYKPVFQEQLSASEFIKTMKENGSNIKSSRFILLLLVKWVTLGALKFHIRLWCLNK